MSTAGARSIWRGWTRETHPAVEVMRAGVTKEALDETVSTCTPGCSKPTACWHYVLTSFSQRWRNAPSLSARDRSDVFRIAARPDWPGYFGRSSIRKGGARGRIGDGC